MAVIYHAERKRQEAGEVQAPYGKNILVFSHITSLHTLQQYDEVPEEAYGLMPQVNRVSVICAQRF